jgi:thiosulfate dehydrogenase [quinone] large subunit
MKNPMELMANPEELETPRAISWLTRSKLMAVAWAAMRIWLGIMWIQAGVAKLWGAENPSFLHHNGAGVAGFAAHGVASYSWWASFLHAFVVPNAGWIGVFVSVAELLAGIGLVLGFLTPAAALGALVLNLTYMLSGTAGVNPFYALFAVVILATWRTSGWIGVDGLLGGYLQRHRDGSARHVLGRRHGVAGTIGHAKAA